MNRQTIFWIEKLAYLKSVKVAGNVGFGKFSAKISTSFLKPKILEIRHSCLGRRLRSSTRCCAIQIQFHFFFLVCELGTGWWYWMSHYLHWNPAQSFLFKYPPGQHGAEGRDQRARIWARRSWVLEINSSEKKETDQKTDTGQWWGQWRLLWAWNEGKRTYFLPRTLTIKSKETFVSGAEGCLEKAQEEVLPDDAKCDNADNLTFFQKRWFFRSFKFCHRQIFLDSSDFFLKVFRFLQILIQR